MARRTDIFNVGKLGLSSGEGRRLEVEVAVDPFEFGGQRYELRDGVVDAVLDISHTVSGYAFRLRFHAGLEGPCVRCLETADQDVEVDAREIDQPDGGEDLDSPYYDEGELDVRSWARDALALALPTSIVCRTCWFVGARLRDHTSAARPATCGDAIEVPSRKS